MTNLKKALTVGLLATQVQEPVRAFASAPSLRSGYWNKVNPSHSTRSHHSMNALLKGDARVASTHSKSRLMLSHSDADGVVKLAALYAELDRIASGIDPAKPAAMPFNPKSPSPFRETLSLLRRCGFFELRSGQKFTTRIQSHLHEARTALDNVLSRIDASPKDKVQLLRVLLQISMKPIEAAKNCYEGGENNKAASVLLRMCEDTRDANLDFIHVYAVLSVMDEMRLELGDHEELPLAVSSFPWTDIRFVSLPGGAEDPEFGLSRWEPLNKGDYDPKWNAFRTWWSMDLM